MTLQPNGPAFSAHEVTKVYRMGEVEVHALRGVDLELMPSELVVWSASVVGTSSNVSESPV